MNAPTDYELERDPLDVLHGNLKQLSDQAYEANARASFNGWLAFFWSTVAIVECGLLIWWCP